MLYLTSSVHNPHFTDIFMLHQPRPSWKKAKKNYKKIEHQKMEESFGLGKKSYGPETDTET